MTHKLKKGYTTGVHTSFAFRSALDTFVATNELSTSNTIKMDNDDLDVTKGCQIVVTISSKLEELSINSIKHNPYILKHLNSSIKIYSGLGVGVVTKDGLKPPKNYPAINPKPLEVIEDIFKRINVHNLNLYCTVSVVDGEKLAKQTANVKVGIQGGISILGTTGFVKPISSTAYIHSINEELNYAYANGYKRIIFTLGNTAFSKTKNLDSNSYVVEIGNFIYDGIKLADDKKFEHIELWLGIGKAVKVSQGFQNTHNRFGSIDFNKIQQLVSIDIKDCLTIKRVRELLGKDCEKFDKLIVQNCTKQLASWFKNPIKIKIY